MVDSLLAGGKTSLVAAPAKELARMVVVFCATATSANQAKMAAAATEVSFMLGIERLKAC